MMTSSAAASSSPPPSSGDPGGRRLIDLSTDTDAAYCTELSRRSVARAALHLGIEGMETSALDVLGSVLLGYLENVGSTIASNVEGGGRSSAHVNAYDVLNAVEGCTAVAATQVRSSAVAAPLVSGAAAATVGAQPQQQPPDHERLMREASGRGWEGLASFLFGPNWYSIPLEGEDSNKKEDRDKKSSSTTAATTTSSSSVPTGINGTVMNGGGKGLNNNSSTGKILPSGNNTIQTPTTTSTTAATTTTAVAATTTTSTTGVAKSGKGKQLSNMTPPPGVTIAATTNTNEKNVSFSLERQTNTKGDSSSSSHPGKNTTAMISGGGDNDDEGDDDINNITTIKNNNNNKPINSNDPFSSSSGRWDAPYLNEVAPFPLVTHTEDIANPHCLSGTKIILSMHDLAMEPEACRDNTTALATSLSSSLSVSNKKQRRGSLGGSSASSGGGGGGGVTSSKMRSELKIPKDVFTTKDIIWGSIKYDDSKKKKDESSKTVMTTTDDKSSVGGTGGGGGLLPKLPSVKMPSYVPNFFPPFPRTDETILSLPSVPTTAVMSDIMSRVSQKRKFHFASSSSGNNTDTAAERNTVRQSLVKLGKNAVGPSYWGSNWLNNENDDDDDDTRKSKEKLKKSNNTAGQLTVTPGPSSAALGRPSDNKKAGGGGSMDTQVVPLARASGSRVAKILEGSN
jgi:uncharacterized membrane protein YgcG